jgi:hypothetical protein
VVFSVFRQEYTIYFGGEESVASFIGDDDAGALVGQVGELVQVGGEAGEFTVLVAVDGGHGWGMEGDGITRLRGAIARGACAWRRLFRVGRRVRRG